MLHFNDSSESIFDNMVKTCNNKDMVLFGASNLGEKALLYMNNKGIEIKYFCDNDKDKWNTYFNNILIISPVELSHLNKNINIVITSMYYPDILKQLTNMGFKNIYYRNLFGYEQKFYNKDYIKHNMDNINGLYDILYDDKSKLVLTNLINHRMTNNFKYLKNIFQLPQYFVDDIFKFNNEEVFVDAGAYIGDTIENFILKVNNKFKKIYAFEPDDKNNIKLRSTIKRLNISDRVIIEQAGVYDKSEIMKFCGNGNFGSHIDNNGGQTINLISLDNYLKEKVTFIKMDIEGAEIKALIGAKNIIRKFKPKLAVCVYHKPEDLWEIPLYIKQIVPDYKIYLRQHSLDMMETVCYAVCD